MNKTNVCHVKLDGRIIGELELDGKKAYYFEYLNLGMRKFVFSVYPNNDTAKGDLDEHKPFLIWPKWFSDDISIEGTLYVVDMVVAVDSVKRLHSASQIDRWS